MQTAVRIGFSGIMVLDTGTGGFAPIQRCAIAPVLRYRRPFRKHGQRSWAKLLKFSSAVNDLAVHNCQHGFNGLYLFLRHGKVILGEGGNIRQLADGDGAFLAVFTREPTAALSVEPQCPLSAKAVCFGIQRRAANRFPGNEPV